MVIAVLFTIANSWSQLRCPSTDGWLKKTWCIFTMKYYSMAQKNKIMSFAGK
jgi:hypothetical protein